MTNHDCVRNACPKLVCLDRCLTSGGCFGWGQSSQSHIPKQNCFPSALGSLGSSVGPPCLCIWMPVRIAPSVEGTGCPFHPFQCPDFRDTYFYDCPFISAKIRGDQPFIHSYISISALSILFYMYCIYIHSYHCQNTTVSEPGLNPWGNKTFIIHLIEAQSTFRK